MKIKIVSASMACIALMTVCSQGAALVTFNIDTGNRLLRDNTGAALTPGVLGTDHDGAVVQIGYFQSATVGNNFGNGTFVALTGEGSVFGVLPTTIGDSFNNGTIAGQYFSDPINLFAGTNGGANDGLFPAVNTPLSIRFYNKTTIALSTFSETVSNNLWLWKAPANSPSQPIINLSFDSAGLLARSGAVVATPGSNINTSTPTAAPEPTSAALLLVGLVSLASRRRRVAKV